VENIGSLFYQFSALCLAEPEICHSVSVQIIIALLILPKSLLITFNGMMCNQNVEVMFYTI
jgi:hypothetical protein